MENFTDIEKNTEIGETNHPDGGFMDAETQKRYDELMGDNPVETTKVKEEPTVTQAESIEMYDMLFNKGDFFEEVEEKKPEGNGLGDGERPVVYADGTEGDATDAKADSSEADAFEKDDNGNDYMKNGELIPDNEYTKNGNTYKTDGEGRVTSFDSKPTYTENGDRDLKEQKEAGGDERKEDDDGGHLIARVLGGSDGKENLVAMRRTINRGDYGARKMEKEIADALKEGKDVRIHGEIEYEGDSKRPSKITVECLVDGEKTVYEFDNKENSTELLEGLEGKLSKQDYSNLCDEIEDMKADGCEASITSVKTEYDENGNPTRIIVGVLNEDTSEKTYKVYYVNGEDK